MVEAGGRVETTQSDRHAIEVTDDGAVINIAGSITATGTGNAIHVVGDDAEITISGRLAVTGNANAVAIYLDGSGITLTLTETAFIVGDIDADGVTIIDNRRVRSLTEALTSVQTIEAGKELIVENAGSVTISTGAMPAVTLSGAGAKLTNKGTISSTSSTSGAYAVLISANDGTVENSGTIETTQASAHAIHSAGNIATVTISHMTGSISTQGATAHAIYIPSGGNGVTTIRDNVSATGSSSYAIHLADTNQLDLELGNGETITGRIKIGTAGVDDNNTPDITADDTDRTHSIVVGTGGIITTALNDIYLIEGNRQG